MEMNAIETNQEIIQNVKNGIEKISATNIRVLSSTKDLLADLIKKSNKKAFGKRVKGDHIVNLALSLIGDEHITKLQKNSMTEDDQEEFIFNEYIKENGQISKGQFKRLMFKGELTKFIKKLGLEL